MTCLLHFFLYITLAASLDFDIIRLCDIEYTFQGEIGEGAFGHVFLAKYGSNNSLMAIKVMELKSKKEIKIFENEYTIMNEFKGHENIVQLHCHDRKTMDAGKLYGFLVMEYCPAGDLYKLVPWKYNNNAGERIDASQLLSDMSKAMKILHEKRINVHRDISPGNIFKCSNGGYKLADFGFSIQLNKDQKTIISTGSLSSYAAPELQAILRESYRKMSVYRYRRYLLHRHVRVLCSIISGRIF